jgi:hypothetical protein
VTAERHKGILPRILEELHSSRNKAKKKVKEFSAQAKGGCEKAASLAKVWDGRQLALKVSMNSVYGACGATDTGKFPDLAVSAAVTLQGRRAMVIKKEILPQRFPGIEIVYGDSVAEYTPLLLLVSGRVHTETPSDLWERAEGKQSMPDGKEAGLLSDVFTWTEEGWTRVTTLIRHRVQKKMYRVSTRTGSVDVTEDHSLLTDEGKECKASDCVVGQTKLLSSWPSSLSVVGEGILSPPCSPSLAKILGMFAGHGCCNVYDYKGWGKKYNWSINSKNDTLLLHYKELCESVLGHPFKILNFRVTAGVYKLVPLEGMDEIVDLFMGMCYSGGEKQVPVSVLNGNVDLRTNFLIRFCNSDLAKGNIVLEGGTDSMHEGGRLSLGVYALFRSIGFHVSVSSSSGGYGLMWSTLPIEGEENVLDVSPVQYGGSHVYDLTTSNHHFHAGVGQIIVHNTDSVMVVFPDAEDVQTCGRRGEEASSFVTDHFSSLGYPEMKLEFEKCYLPYLLEAKKRYSGLKFEPDSEGTMVCKGIDSKGIETERKDTLPFLKEVMHGCLDALMNRMDEKEALSIFHSKMDDLIENRVHFSKFVMRKNLSAKVEGRTDTIVQARVNSLRKERNPGSEVAAGEQVEYVIVNGHKNEKTTHLAEDPVYAFQNGLKLNYLWYFEHAIRDAVKKLFSVFEEIDFNKICLQIQSRLDSKRLGVGSSLRDMFVPSSSSSSPPSIGRVHVPRPPPPPKRRKK